MGEVVVSGITYRFGKLNPKQQLHIARRLAPLALAFKGTEEEIGAAFADYIAKMTDSEVDAVVDPCLILCQNKIADGVWAPLTAPNGSIMQENIGAKEIFELTIAVLKENLGNFFPGQGAGGALATAIKQ